MKCQSPCAQCIGNAQTCTVCQPSFNLIGWKCVSNFNFGFSLVLSATLQTFYQNYASFLLTISQNVGSSNVNSITVNSIEQGSVIISGNINTAATSDSNLGTTQY